MLYYDNLLLAVKFDVIDDNLRNGRMIRHRQPYVVYLKCPKEFKKCDFDCRNGQLNAQRWSFLEESDKSYPLNSNYADDVEITEITVVKKYEPYLELDD